jgi:hypothetical protein
MHLSSKCELGNRQSWPIFYLFISYFIYSSSSRCKEAQRVVTYALLQDLTQDSATLTGWRRTKRSGEGKMIALYSRGICGLRYRSFP